MRIKSSPHDVSTSMFLSVFLVLVCFLSAAQDVTTTSPISYEGHRVSSVEIAGRPDLELKALRSLISQPVDATYSQEKVDETVAALKNAGQFQAVELHGITKAAVPRVLFDLQPSLTV